jgi:hypothetical protein
MMSMGQDYVPEMRPTGPLLIPQEIHTHREPWWNDTDRGELIYPPQRPLAILPEGTSSSKPGGTWQRG